MKILIIGKDNFFYWPQMVEAGLQENHHQTKLFLFNQSAVYQMLKPTGNKLRLQYLSYRLRATIKNFQPDLIFLVSAFFIPEALYQVLQDFPHIKKAGWAGDYFDGKHMMPMANILDFLFLTDSGFFSLSKDFVCKTFFLPGAFSPLFLKPTDEPRTEPPFFVGVANPKRSLYLQTCQQPCVIYGKGWDKQALKQHDVHNQMLHPKKVQHFLNKTICSINLPFSPNNMNGLNLRTFDIGGTKGLIMYHKSKDLHDCYQVGSEALEYDTPEDFNHLITDIAHHPKKYDAIREAGYQKTMRSHTYAQRMKEMLAMCGF